MNETVYNPILDLLADHKPRTIGQIEAAVKDKNIAFGQVRQAMMVLAGAHHIAPVQDEVTSARARKHTDRVNAYLKNKARANTEINYLTSPVIGGGVQAPRFHQLFLLALELGKKQPQEWVHFIWQLLESQGQRILKDGVTLQSAEENQAELMEQAQEFAQKRLPIMRALGIA